MRVLLVEDEPLIAEFVAKGLREAGHSVVVYDRVASRPLSASLFARDALRILMR